MLELSLTKILLSQEMPLYVNAAAFDEGSALEFIMGTTQVATGAPTGAANTVQPTSGSSTVFAGFALNVFTRPSTGVWIDTLTISSTTYQVTLTQIPTAVNTVSVVTAVSGGTLWTQIGSAPSATQYIIGGTNNQTLTFNAANAGVTVIVTYRYALTVQQAELFVGDGVAGGYSPSSVLYSTGVIERGVVFTSDFDSSQNWGAGNIANMTGAAGGLVTINGGGCAISGTVYQVPTTDIPFLGIYLKA